MVSLAEHIERAVRDITWGSLPSLASHNTRHELVKSRLVQLGDTLGYDSFPEINPTEQTRKKIDVVWFDDDPVVAIEVDGGAANKSINKLHSLKDGYPDVACFIVSKTSSAPKASRATDKLSNYPNIEHVDAKLYEHDRFKKRSVRNTEPTYYLRYK